MSKKREELMALAVEAIKAGHDQSLRQAELYIKLASLA